MNPAVLFVAAIVAVLVGLTAAGARRQVVNLRQLRGRDELSPEDRTYVRRQAYRRLAASGVMLVLAGMLAGAYLSGLMRQIDEQIAVRDAEKAANGENARPPTEEQQRFYKLFGYYWLTVLVLVLVLVGLAGVDLLAIRRYSDRHLRALRNAQAEMLRHEVEQLRARRNGQQNGRA